MRRHIVVLFLALAGINSLFAAAVSTPEMRVLQDKGSSVTVEIVLNGYDTETIDINGKPCTQIRVPGLVNYLQKGYPELPVINRNVIIPDEGAMACRIISADYETKVVGTIVPSKGNLYRNVDPATVPYEFGKIYEEDTWWPTNAAEISKPFIMRDYRGVSVCFNPFMYNPVRGELKIAKRIVVEIYKNGPGGENVIKKQRGALLDEFVDIYRNLFINFNDSRYDSISERPGRMLIITADAYNANMANFLKWKKRKGIFTKLVNVSTVGNTAAAIKARIQAEYDSTDLAWVLLVGDGNEVVPAVGTMGAASGADCDPVYTYLAGGDYYQDAFISRMSSRGGTALNIDKQTSRSILYETTPQMAGTWYRTATGIASNQSGGSPSYADSTRMNFLRDSLKTPKYYYTRFDTSYDSWGTAALIKSHIETGTGYINYIGHGSQTSWVNGGGFSNSDLASLNNPWKLPFVVSVACVVGDFDGGDCFCEVSVTCGEVAQPDGFLVHWGSTINQSWEPPCWGQAGAVGQLTHNQKNTFGGLCFNGASYMIEHYGASAAEGVEMAQTWTIFGDASVQCRSNLVDSLVVTHNPTVSPVPMSFLVNVKDNDNVTPIQNALVCCYISTQSPEMHATGWTDASGNATISVNPLNVNDTMWVTVTRYNYKPYQGFALVFDAGIPATPSIVKPMDFGRMPDLNPTLTFTSTDPQNQNIIYRVLWDTDPAFASPESSTTANYASGAVVDFNFPSNLANGLTYWWKVKCTDVGGSGYWTSYTTSRSFTVDTSLPANTCSWYQTTAAQFGFNTFNSTVIQGDSVVLVAAGSVVVETLQVQPFASASMPSGWTVVNGNGDAYQWVVGTTSDLGSYTPPGYGSYYAYYSDDDAGSGNISNNEELLSPKWYVGGLTGSVVMEYGWGFQV
ncbi:MAG TPA: C25 family cysteine peptidase, partial [bacterium]